MQSNDNSLNEQFWSLSSQASASPGQLSFTISSESPKSVQERHELGLILQFCFRKSATLSSSEHDL